RGSTRRSAADLYGRASALNLTPDHAERPDFGAKDQWAVRRPIDAGALRSWHGGPQEGPRVRRHPARALDARVRRPAITAAHAAAPITHRRCSTLRAKATWVR